MFESGSHLFSTGNEAMKGPSWSRIFRGHRNQSASTTAASLPVGTF